MSKVDKSGQPNYHRFDLLSNEELEILLQAFFVAPDAEQMDYDAVMYISELLAKREGTDEEISQENIDVAKAEFFKHYYPLKDKKTLYDFDDEENEYQKGTENHNLVSFTKRLWRGFASAAAVFILFVFVGTATAYALGYNPVSFIAKWNDDFFWFEKATVTSKLADTVAEYNKEVEVVPKWLPEGYIAGDIKISTLDSYTFIDASFCKEIPSGTEQLNIGYTIYYEDINSTFYEKDRTDVTEYIVNGIKHYIMGNLDRRTITWYNNNFECFIAGSFSLEDAKEIINSIY